MRRGKDSIISRKVFIVMVLLAMTAVCGPGAKAGRCSAAGGKPPEDSGKEAAPGSAVRILSRHGAGFAGGVTAALSEIWGTFGGGAEISDFSADAAVVPSRRITWPLVRGPMKVSLGASASLEEGVRIGPFLLMEMRF